MGARTVFEPTTETELGRYAGRQVSFALDRDQDPSRAASLFLGAADGIARPCSS